uniref:Uncharacterized protein n=1 Tax=Meloidogyne incognita TaxID=6306 RepID=A0A914LUJ4_MELIC
MSDYKQNSGGSSHIDVINQRLLGYYQDLQKKLYECVKNEKIQNKEILKELHLILKKQFESDPNSRCLIFVATRNCASKLADHLKKVPELPIFYNKEFRANQKPPTESNRWARPLRLIFRDGPN